MVLNPSRYREGAYIASVPRISYFRNGDLQLRPTYEVWLVREDIAQGDLVRTQEAAHRVGELIRSRYNVAGAGSELERIREVNLDLRLDR